LNIKIELTSPLLDNLRTWKMRKAKIYVKGVEAGTLTELLQGKDYLFEYLDGYEGLEISRTMPRNVKVYKFDKFPPFFDGLLPEGIQLDGLLKIKKSTGKIISHN